MFEAIGYGLLAVVTAIAAGIVVATYVIWAGSRDND